MKVAQSEAVKAPASAAKLQSRCPAPTAVPLAEAVAQMVLLMVVLLQKAG